MSDFLLVDAGSLQALWQSFGNDKGLNQLLASGRKVVVTRACLAEIDVYDGFKSVKNWVKAHAIIPEFDDAALADAQEAWRDGIITEEARDKIAKQAGDREIMAIATGKQLDGNTVDFGVVNEKAVKAVKGFAPEGAKFQIITDDFSLHRKLTEGLGELKSLAQHSIARITVAAAVATASRRALRARATATGGRIAA
jgi:hypothetical protein